MNTSTGVTGGPFRAAAVLVWLLIAAAYLAFFIIDLRLDYFQLLEPCAGPGCNWAAITSAETAVLESWGLTARAYASLYAFGICLAVAGFWLMGGLIFWRQRADRVGLFMSLVLVVIPIAAFADSDNVAAVYPALAFPTVVLSTFGLMAMLLFAYTFPNGRFYPRWAFIPYLVSAVVAAGLLLGYENYVLPLSPLIDEISAGVFSAVLLSSMVFQYFRFRNASTDLERQQTKWVLFGILAFMTGPFLWAILYPGGVNFPAGQTRLLAMSLGWIIINVVQLALPVSLAFAIFRHRLWDIDLIIRRTLIYGLLTGLLALVYFGSITTLQGLFSAFSENQSQAAIVISTLVIAAVFNPLRLRLQDTIDRRFYRARYDAERSLARFAAAARDEVDVTRLAGALQGVIQETIQPKRTSLWLRKLDVDQS